MLQNENITIQDNANLEANAQEIYDLKQWAISEANSSDVTVTSVIVFINSAHKGEYAISADFYTTVQDLNFMSTTFLSNISS